MTQKCSKEGELNDGSLSSPPTLAALVLLLPCASLQARLIVCKFTNTKSIARGWWRWWWYISTQARRLWMEENCCFSRSSVSKNISRKPPIHTKQARLVSALLFFFFLRVYRWRCQSMIVGQAGSISERKNSRELPIIAAARVVASLLSISQFIFGSRSGWTRRQNSELKTWKRIRLSRTVRIVTCRGVLKQKSKSSNEWGLNKSFPVPIWIRFFGIFEAKLTLLCFSNCFVLFERKVLRS